MSEQKQRECAMVQPVYRKAVESEPTRQILFSKELLQDAGRIKQDNK